MELGNQWSHRYVGVSLFNMSLNVSQAQQRLIDQFRAPVGSAAVSVLLAYLASCPVKQDSDEERVKWCEEQLQHYKFVYRDSTGSKPKVSVII